MTDGIRISVSIRDAAAQSGNPERFEQTVARYLDRAALEASRVMQGEVPKAFSTLWTSIHIVKTDEYERLIAPSVNYARAVAEGTGPAAGRARYFPNPIYLREYVKLRSRISFNAKPGSAPRRRAENEVRDRAWALARFIHEHGTKPNPFHTRTAQKSSSRCIALLEQGVIEGLRASFGGAA